MRRSSVLSRGGLALVALIAASCDGCDDDEVVCDPESTRPCSCDGGSDGTQICDPSGREWSVCDCATPDGDADADSDGDGDGDSDACTPDCGGRVCGDDGCGGSCGDCDTGEECDDEGLCVVTTACGHQPSLPTCEDTERAPTDDDAIVDFCEENAIPVVCMEDDRPIWELDVYVDDFAGMRVFMMGETHGSNEIGPASVALFGVLYAEGLVEAAALEIGMDTTDAMSSYVETGGGDFVTVYGANALGENMFRRVFPDDARRRYLDDGTVVSLFGIDYPQRLAWVNEQLLEIAELIDDTETRAIVLDTMPEPKEQEEYGLMGLATAYVTSCQTYHEHIVANLDGLCAALPSEDACDRVEHLAFALWVGAIFNSQDFMIEMMTGGTHVEEWFAYREELIFWNYRRVIEEVDGGLYAHMGSAHTAKGGFSTHVAEMLDEEHGPTAGTVYTVAPAYGPGSRIFYTLGAQSVPEEPELVSEALADAAVDSYYLSTIRPGFDCTENPFPSVLTDIGLPGTSYGHWDAFFWFRRLTPDVPTGGWGKLRLTPNETAALENVRRTRIADEAMLLGHP